MSEKVLIEVIDSPGCAKCKAVKKTLRRVMKDFKSIEYREVNVLDNPQRITELGVMVTPTIAIDGGIVFERIPKEDELKERIKEFLEKK
jgi:glutaredoxin